MPLTSICDRQPFLAICNSICWSSFTTKNTMCCSAVRSRISGSNACNWKTWQFKSLILPTVHNDVHMECNHTLVKNGYFCLLYKLTEGLSVMLCVLQKPLMCKNITGLQHTHACTCTCMCARTHRIFMECSFAKTYYCRTWIICFLLRSSQYDVKSRNA